MLELFLIFTFGVLGGVIGAGFAENDMRGFVIGAIIGAVIYLLGRFSSGNSSASPFDDWCD